MYSEQPLHILDDNTASTGEDNEEKHENRETCADKNANTVSKNIRNNEQVVAEEKSRES